MTEYTITAKMVTPDGEEFTRTNISDHYDSQEEAERLEAFDWLENNYSCDCNRSVFAVQAGALEEQLECDCSEPTIKLLSLTVNGTDVDLEAAQ